MDYRRFLTTPAPIPEPAPTKFTQYANGADAIQQRCACIRWDPRECYEARHDPRRRDDLDEGRPDWDDDECECRCHDELHQLEEDIFGPRDESPTTTRR